MLVDSAKTGTILSCTILNIGVEFQDISFVDFCPVSGFLKLIKVKI
jgi:hypothetical protein